MLIVALVGIAGIVTLVLAFGRTATPVGQVLATINGAEVTVQDVEAESRATGVPVLTSTRAALLDRVVSRRLLAALGRRQKLDKTPTAPSDLARVQQTWLAQQALRGELPPLTAPDGAILERVAATHPYSFARRTSLTLDTLNVSGAPALAATLGAYTDLDAASAFVRRLGLRADRRTMSVDSAQLPPKIAAQLALIPDGGMLLRVEPGRLELSRVIARTPVLLPPAAQSALAQQLWAQETTAERVRAEVTRLRSTSRIVYAAPGLHPPSGPSAADPAQAADPSQITSASSS